MDYPYLCGGVFFLLLGQATHKNGSSKDHTNGIKDNHSNTKVTVDLIYALSEGTYYPEAPTIEIASPREVLMYRLTTQPLLKAMTTW